MSDTPDHGEFYRLAACLDDGILRRFYQYQAAAQAGVTLHYCFDVVCTHDDVEPNSSGADS